MIERGWPSGKLPALLKWKNAAISKAPGGQMRRGLSIAAAFAVAALVSGWQASAAGNSPSASVENPTLLSPQFAPFGSGSFALKQDPLERLLLSARIASVGSLDPVDGLDPVDVAGDQSSDAYSGMFRAIALANSPYSLLTNGGSYFSSSIPLGDNVSAHLGAFAIEPNRTGFGAPGNSYFGQVTDQQAFYELGQSQSAVASLDWDFASWGGLGLVAS